MGYGSENIYIEFSRNRRNNLKSLQKLFFKIKRSWQIFTFPSAASNSGSRTTVAFFIYCLAESPKCPENLVLQTSFI